MTETNLIFEKYEEIISLEELQNFINDDAQNVPKMRRDLKQLGNVTWLLRNLHFKNELDPVAEPRGIWASENREVSAPPTTILTPSSRAGCARGVFGVAV